MIERVIACVVDTLLPGDDGSPPLPRASEAGVDRALAAIVNSDGGAAHRRAVTAICHAAGDAHSFLRAPSGARSVAVATAERSAPAEVRALVVAALEAYYQSEPVIRAMGWRPQSPQPLGHPVEPLDLSLLDPIRRRAPMWR